MKNSILIYDKITNTKYIYSDFTSKKYYKIYDFAQDDTTGLFEWFKLENNDTLEKVAYRLYGLTDYWDILAIINDIDPLVGLPYSFDVLFTQAEEMLAKYIEKNPAINLNGPQKKYLYETYKDKLIAENETKRVIKIVKPSRIQEFFRQGYELGLF